MIDEKLLTLLGAIITKTASGEVNWQESAARNVFAATLGDFTLRISVDDNFVELNILDRDRNTIASIEERELRRQEPAAAEALESLYGSARKMALNVDKKVDVLLQMLA